RMVSRVLAPTSIAGLLGPDWDGQLPEPGTREELDLARRLSTAREGVLGPVVLEPHPQPVDPPTHPRRLRRRLTWLLLRPGRLDRGGLDAGAGAPGQTGPVPTRFAFLQ